MFISHRLDEVFEIADTITVLRDGEVVHSTQEEARVETIAEMMVGRKLGSLRTGGSGRIHGNEHVLEVKNLSVDMLGEHVDNVSFSVRRERSSG